MTDFEAAMDEDLAVAEALAAAFALVRDVNSLLDESAAVSAAELAPVSEALAAFEAVSLPPMSSKVLDALVN